MVESTDGTFYSCHVINCHTATTVIAEYLYDSADQVLLVVGY